MEVVVRKVPHESRLLIEEVLSDTVGCDASDVAARVVALRIALRSIATLFERDGFQRLRYVENDAPGYVLGPDLRVTSETVEELDRRWLENLHLIVEESDRELFVQRCAVAIRPGAHRGTIFADELVIELTYEACEPTSLCWTLPNNLTLDPDEHAALIERSVGETGDVAVHFGYR